MTGVMMMKIVKEVAPAFEDFIFDWDYETYVVFGGYGSGKSYQIGIKLILKLLQEKRKALVVREVYDTIQDSTFDLLREILDSMNLLANPDDPKERRTKVVMRHSPMQFNFPNGSKIIFKGMDKPEKVKSINGVSIVWIEEAPEVKFAGFQELLGRIRTPDVSMHFILSFNPVSQESWPYRYFFASLGDDGTEHIIVDVEELYKRKVMVKGGVYYHHSTPDDNPWLPPDYIKRLDKLRNNDYPLYLVARWGRFGPAGLRVLPQLVVAKDAKKFVDAVNVLGVRNQYFGFDFGFESSYNAVISCSVDSKEGILYIWDEIYMNHVTDPQFANQPEMQKLKRRLLDGANEGRYLVADCEDPKAISYYYQCGFRIRGCKKFAGSRLSNTRKIKRFQQIVVSPKCKNTIRELKDLTYKKDSKGNVIYDQFNIDPHSFSALWYALDGVIVADLKDKRFNSIRG